MAIEVLVTAEFKGWWEGLSEEEQTSVAIVIELLEDFGVTLKFPHSSSITTSQKLRELRIQHAGQPYRVLYAFDPQRNAVLLLGGNKTGDDRWYEKNVTKAEKIFAAYLEETRQTE
ncbi:MAG TPA: type II toxin-antitoxin system RelE/ParE family toxin [Acidobacteriaceae bacterium]